MTPDHMPSNLVRPCRTAITRWQNKNCPDDFTTRVTLKGQEQDHRLWISIQLDETTPAGLQIYAMEVRDSQESRTPDSLLFTANITKQGYTP